MDPRGFCAATRLLIVAGKGGVGKTTVTAALAHMAATQGLDTLIIEIEGRNSLGAAFGWAGPLDYTERLLVPPGRLAAEGRIRGRTVTPDDALLEWLDDHGMRRVSRRLLKSGAVDLVATAAPGIKDILVLGKVKQLERSGQADLILVDAPAAGHAVTFLQSAHGLLDAVRVGPIRTQAHEVVDLLTDPRRCQVVLVTLPEETPVNELVETAYLLEDRAGVQLAPVVVNGVYPVVEGLDVDPPQAAREAGLDLSDPDATALHRAAAFRKQRQALQAEQIDRLAAALPLPQLRLPYLFADAIGPPEIQRLAGALADEVNRLPAPVPVP